MPLPDELLDLHRELAAAMDHVALAMASPRGDGPALATAARHLAAAQAALAAAGRRMRAAGCPAAGRAPEPAT